MPGIVSIVLMICITVVILRWFKHRELATQKREQEKKKDDKNEKININTPPDNGMRI